MATDLLSTWTHKKYDEKRTYLLPKKSWVGELNTGNKPVTISIKYLDQLKALPYPHTKSLVDRYYYNKPYGAGEGGGPGAEKQINEIDRRQLGSFELTIGPKDSIILKEECSAHITGENTVVRTCQLVAYRLPAEIDSGEGYNCTSPLSGEKLASTDPVTLSYRPTLSPQEEQKRSDRYSKQVLFEGLGRIETIVTSEDWKKGEKFITTALLGGK